MKAMVVLNPHAHSGEPPEHLDAVRDNISARLKGALHLDTIDWCETQHAGHGTELAAAAVHNGYDYIFAGGGDGTINEVLNGIMTAHLTRTGRPVMGVLPFGTSNDLFAGLKTAEASRVTDRDALTLDMDVGHVLFDKVERYFCLTIGMGLISWANEQYLDASHTFGRRFAHVPAAISTVLSYRFLPNVKLSLNGKRPKSRRVLSIVATNSPVIAGGTALTPNSQVNDGHLDVCIIKPISLLWLLWLALLVSHKAHTHSKAVALGRISEMTVVAKEPLPIHVDGELVPELNSKARLMKVKVMPHELRVVIPSLCELGPRPEEMVTAPA